MDEAVASEGVQIFISYPREREQAAKDWRDLLRARGYTAYACHIDEEPMFIDLARKLQFARLRDQIAGSAAVLVLWDRNYARAAWCAWELGEAIQRAGVHVLVCRQDATVVPRSLHERVSTVANVYEVEDALRHPSPPPMKPTGLSIFPAASVLESPVAPSFDNPVRTARELFSVLLKLVCCVGGQVLLYEIAKSSMASNMSQHMWSLIVGVQVAMTVVGAVTVSLYGAIFAGSIGLIASLAATLGAIARWGGPSTTMITIAAVATATFHATVLLLVRDRLIGEGWGSPPRTRELPATRRGHGLAAAGVVVVAALLLIGLELLDAALSYIKQHGSDRLEALRVGLEIPVVLGTLVGALVGIPLGASSFRRWLGNYRKTAKRGIPVSATVGIIIAGVATLAGYLVGRWISSNIAAAIGPLAGIYAGSQVGVLLAVGVATPVALGTSQLAPRAERRWALIGASAVIGVIALKVRSFPFAADRDNIPLELLSGALLGAAPVALLRALATGLTWRGRTAVHRVLPWVFAIAVHAFGLALAGPRCSRSDARTDTPTLIEIAFIPVVAAPDPSSSSSALTPSVPAPVPPRSEHPVPKSVPAKHRRQPVLPAPERGDVVLGPEPAGSATYGPPPAPVIDVVSASYGVNCHDSAGNVTAKVASLCNGQATCSYVVNDALLGDPQPGCPKDFVAEWRCGDTAHRTDPVTPREREGYPITMSCP